jgi:catechol 2,3-dioxygenase
MDIGHIHLQISDLATTHAFYHDLLGLDVMMSMPTALFLSAGGYHHHVGANTWHSRNAPRRDPGATGLKSYAYLVPDEAGWLAVFDRVKDKGTAAVERDGRLGVSLEDQDGLRVEILTAATDAVRAALQQLQLVAMR